MLTLEDSQKLNLLIQGARQYQQACVDAKLGSGNRQFERSQARFEALEDAKETLDPTQARQRVAHIVRSIFRLRVPFGSVSFPGARESEALCFEEDFSTTPESESAKLFKPFYHREILETLRGTKQEIIRQFQDWEKSKSGR